jgi:uncharacterized protein
MSIIKRKLEENVLDRINDKKIIIIHGARQVGKTTLAKKVIDKYSTEDVLYLNCEIDPVKNALNTTNPVDLKNYLGDKKIVILDEAQKIENIGLVLKIIADTFPKIRIIATGSSSFELASKTAEPLTGRAARFTLYPLSIGELRDHQGLMDVQTSLEKILRFGLYPSVYFSASEEKARDELDEIAVNYLYKDILSLKASGNQA